MPAKKKPRIAIPSFPGSNGEVDNMRVLKRCGFDPFVFRWNDSLEKLHDVDGYFFGAGFSYEDRGRSGMVAARDPLFRYMHEESERGKLIIGNCNGAQVLIESGLVPLGDGLRMSLARNAVWSENKWSSPGFLNEWVWITPACKRNRCATSDWEGAMHIPIAHGEGRFVTKDPELIAELERNDQVAFRYCDAKASVSASVPFTPNGSTGGIAGVCNPAGNVVAIMPHPERTPLGDEYFRSALRWIQGKRWKKTAAPTGGVTTHFDVRSRSPKAVELFIDTIITNNEERTVEQAARRLAQTLSLKQYRYISMADRDSCLAALANLSVFNANKEVAYVRERGQIYRWNNDAKQLEKRDAKFLKGIALLRIDEPDPGAGAFGPESDSGVCYDCRNVTDKTLESPALLEVFGNPHASTLYRLA